METPMGHVLPGLGFLIIGLWHLFNNMKLFFLNPNTFTSSVWFPISKIRHLELYVIMLSSSTFISSELFFGFGRQYLQSFDSDGPSHHLHNFEHFFIAMSLLVYTVFALVLDRARPRAVASDQGITFLAAAAAFSQELFLFHFHSSDPMGLGVQYHLTLQLVICVTLLTTLMGILLPKSFLVSFVRSSSIVFQGVWFIVMGFMLYTPSLIPKGCLINDEGGHLMVKCSTEEALRRAKSLVNIQFSWLFVINTIFVLTLYLILDRVYGENVEYSRLPTHHDQTEQQQHLKSKSTQKMDSIQMGELVGHG